MTEKLNIKQLKPISTDVNLGNSDVLLPTQKAVKDYVDTTASGLQSEIDDLKGLGRFLSVWNCATGLAETNPPTSPYTYNSGDYFLVGTVDSTTNYKPDGATYTTGVASTTVETDTVKVNDVYIYDGTTWKLQANVQRDVVFSAIQGSPYDNTALSNALNAKQDTLTAGTNINITGTTISATDTTYTGSDGVTLTGTNFTNSGVRAVASGTANGTISVNTNGISADVSVTGLGSAAYTASSAYDASGAASTAETNAKNYADGLAVNYATAAQGAKADSALQQGDNVSELVNDAGYLTQHQTLADLGITATASEINVLDGITASTTELNYVGGVTSAIQPQLNNKISYNAIIQNLNSFNNNGRLFLSTIDNCFYSLNRRFTVSGTGFTSFNAAALFDGVFENYSYNNVDVGGTGVVTVTGTAITGTYRQGYILISFYSGRGPKAASDVTIQIENANGNVATLTPTAYSTNGLVLIAEVPTLPTANAISKITFTFVNNRTSGTVNPVELEYFCSRPSNTGLLSYVSKTGNGTIYGDLTADSFVKSGGTSSQFLKADGSVDSTTYAPSASIPTTLAGLIGDVSISSPTDGQSLIYDGNTSKWKNVSSSVSVGFSAITGSPYDNTNLANELNNIDCGTMS